MSDIDPLLLNFASTRPANVAELVADYAPQELMEFLQALPGDVAAPIMARLSTQQLNNVLPMMAPAAIGRILLTGTHADATSILAHLPASLYPEILNASPDTDRATLQRHFQYPTRTLSALATPEFVRVEQDMTCGQLKAQLENIEDLADRPVFVVDRTARYRGMVLLASVLPARNAELPVARVLRTVEALSGRTPIVTALSAPQWKQYPALAVVDVQQHILGAVTLAQLEHAVSMSDLKPYGVEDMIQQVATSYIDLCAELLDAATGRES